MLDTIHYTLGDCIEGMKQFPDGFFDLAVVDPPYEDYYKMSTERIIRETVQGTIF